MKIAPNIPMENTWREVLFDQMQQDYYREIIQYLQGEKQLGKTIYPPDNKLFNAFNSTPFNKIKVVIIGQDPYHRPEQAMGLSFSVPKHIKTPPSLKNIYKEINRSLDIPIPEHGDLSYWAQQGVFLLNAFLTVEAGKPGSHRKIGWEKFTDAVIQTLSDQHQHLVFMLWGNFAIKKKDLIDENQHLILTSAHPSPLARNRFAGNNHFIDANSYLCTHNKQPIDWAIK
ncbi:uracil-DNA glycosylase [Membranihabitans marinus]|uniref:uracil-DNA glycosylase n=1 Tax=Membranihabitans marinus TaxID=1227546 RepID=UPI001F00F05B|nr:uracil-DNA glycosylase [Membranihabitans marinus]